VRLTFAIANLSINKSLFRKLILGRDTKQKNASRISHWRFFAMVIAYIYTSYYLILLIARLTL
ncbi:hypothetical protein, partial [Psychrobacter sp. Rd 27.2]|uniref:hypothetical protein n=1 Tax=Psychrobacter sp. Rd 27.2 TaxID=1926479 RepID=UPI001C4A395D